MISAAVPRHPDSRGKGGQGRADRRSRSSRPRSADSSSSAD